MSKAKAYSYLRFSTPEQQKGDSKRRQMELAHHYAKTHDLDLDETLTFHDLGVSAFRGKNRDAALGAFIKALEDGRVKKGSYLLVESLDRLSRERAIVALSQLNEILSLGAKVATLHDQKVYTKASLDEPTDLLLSLMIMIRAHEESATKAKRMKAAWKGKRERAATSGLKITARCPAWLTLDKDSDEFQVVEERVPVIQRIFNMTLEGIGKRKIAETFNVEGLPTFGKSVGWQPSYIQKILDNEAVIGNHQPMRREFNEDGKRIRIPEGEPIKDYYPPVVDKAVFYRARELRSARRMPSGQRGKRFSNLFSGLAKCGVCGASMNFINKGKGWTYLQCSNARRKVGNCTAHSWPYQETEVWILWTGVNQIDFSELYPSMVKGTKAALKGLEDAQMTTKADLVQSKASLAALMDAIQERQSNPHLLDRLDELTAQEHELKKKLTEIYTNIEQEQDRLNNAETDFKATQDALGEFFIEQDTTDDDKAYQLRARLNQLLKRVIAEMKFYPGDEQDKSGRTVDVELKNPVLTYDQTIEDFEMSGGFTLEML